MRWQQDEDAFLCFHGNDRALEQLAARLCRSPAAVRRRLLRLGVSRGEALSLEALARRCGVDREVVVRIAGELGLRLDDNGRKGRGRRITVSEAQAEAVVARLREGGPRWSRASGQCVKCKRSDRPHHGAGLCRSCYRAFAKAKARKAKGNDACS